jgi:hypothetical protein
MGRYPRQDEWIEAVDDSDHPSPPVTRRFRRWLPVLITLRLMAWIIFIAVLITADPDAASTGPS